MDPPSPTEAPPPAYDAAQIEFDRKISDAVERSLHISEPPGEDSFEVWDETVYETNKQAREQGGKVQSGSQPLEYYPEKARLALGRDTARALSSVQEASSSSTSKSYLPSSPPAKERPHWLADAQVGAPVALSGQGPSASDLTANRVFDLPPEDEYPDEELPPFSAVGPSLEGPPFEEVVRQPGRYPPSQTDSPPESPLDSVDPFENPQRPRNLSPRRPYHDVRYQNVPVQRVTSRSPVPIRHSHLAPSRPPAMPFDPTIAYSRNSQHVEMENEVKGPVDAAAFYNSTVSSLMKTQSLAARRLPSIPQAPNPPRLGGNLYSSSASTYSNTQTQPATFPLHQGGPVNQNSSFPSHPDRLAPYAQFSQPPPLPSSPFQQQYSQRNPGALYPSNVHMALPPSNVPIPLPPPSVPMLPPALSVPVPPPPPPPHNLYNGFGHL